MTAKKIPTSKEVAKATFDLLEERGVTVLDIAEIVYDLQL
ncbi:phosphatidylglycerophosphatase A, partial [Bacillus subtilis]|nr:phosphatidylglycerophosphatase A [Bacillus subtilis]